MRPPVEPRCIECGGLGSLTTRTDRRGETRLVYACACGAQVGCHPGSTIPLGFPCGPKTARARDRAHRALDPLWKPAVAAGARRFRARNSAYVWLAKALGIKREACHISQMDEATCLRVIEICRDAAPD